MSVLISLQRPFTKHLMKFTQSLVSTITHEISLVTIAVAHFHEPGVITNKDASFRIFKEGDWFKAVPQLSAADRRATGLPEELLFIYWNHVVLASNNSEEETMAVIKNIILELEVLNLV